MLTAKKKALERERAKMVKLAKTSASERAVYPDLYAATVEEFKHSTEFQIVVDTDMITSLPREVGSDAGPSNVATTELVEGQTKSAIIENFQQVRLFQTLAQRVLK